MFANISVGEYELEASSQKELSDMTDEYMNKVEEQYGHNIRKIIEALISARMFNNAMASAMGIFHAEAQLAELTSMLVASYAALSTSQVARAYGVDPTEEQMEEWAAVAERFIDNANSIARTATIGKKLH
jgi:RES domain-containing protein